MVVQRNHSRVASRTFQDFRAQVTVTDRYFAGELGDIAEAGLCLVLPGDVRVSDGEEIQGEIRAEHLALSMQFAGKVAWTSDGIKAGQPCRLVGVSFDQELELPEAVIALGMSAA